MSSPPTEAPGGRALSVAAYDSPTGPLILTATGHALVRLTWGHTNRADGNPVLDIAMRQLDRYFADPLFRFDLPLAPEGTDFQQAVWAIMQTIPSGQTLTYGDVAARLDAPAEASIGAARAVGAACGANPIPVIIPCHRITAANGRLGGFSGGKGVETKTWLLTHERWPGVQPGPLFAALEETSDGKGG